jgi:hypothetical protein
MHAPPDPHSERAASAKAAPVSQFEDDLSTAETDTGPTDLQARQLQNRFAAAYCIACSLAPLVWGLPR